MDFVILVEVLIRLVRFVVLVVIFVDILLFVIFEIGVIL